MAASSAASPWLGTASVSSTAPGVARRTSSWAVIVRLPDNPTRARNTTEIRIWDRDHSMMAFFQEEKSVVVSPSERFSAEVADAVGSMKLGHNPEQTMLWLRSSTDLVNRKRKQGPTRDGYITRLLVGISQVRL